MIPAGGPAVVLSGGGERAIAWEVGALAGWPTAAWIYATRRRSLARRRGPWSRGGSPPALRVVAIDAERGERIVLDAAAASTVHWDRRPTPTCLPVAPPRA
jgi:hypothetical protein